MSRAADADIVVVNTCAVTAKAGAQSRRRIRKHLKETGAGRMVVTGCYAQTAADEIRKLFRNSVIVGNSDKENLVALALGEAHGKNGASVVRDMGRIGKFAPLTADSFPGRTRAYLKIQDGCNSFCSYCIVPYARGRSRSLPLEQALQQAERFQDNGFQELVITGIHIGFYGRDLTPPLSLDTLVDTLTTRYPATRFRISSLEPMEISDTLLALMAERDNLMPHFHIPLQSGDDTILAAMRRRYTSADFASVVARITRKIPHAAIGIDVLTGFPGEDDNAFHNTRTLLQELPLAFFHVFPFSPRPGTPAATMDGQVSGPVKEERSRLLRQLGREKRLLFFKKNLGRTVRVLPEQSDEQKKAHGFSDNYIPVTITDRFVGGKIVPVRLQSVSPRGMTGHLAQGVMP